MRTEKEIKTKLEYMKNGKAHFVNSDIFDKDIEILEWVLNELEVD